MARKRSKKPIEDPPTAASSSFSSSEEEETSSEEETQTQKNPTLNVKPIATKAMEETSKTKKPKSKPLDSPINAKRPRESEQEPKGVKRPKKKTGEERSGSAAVIAEVRRDAEDAKKLLFQRLFSEDDEIAVLKGMLDYLAKKGVEPFADTNAFHDFVKKSIHSDVSKAQLMYKVRRLRKKFENNAGKGKNGEDRTFSKPHEQKIFELSKKIWGKERITGKVQSSADMSNGKAKGNNKALAALRAELLSSPNKKMKVDGMEKMEVDKKWSKSWVSLFDKRFGVDGLEDEVLKRGLDMIGGEKKAALEEKWRKLVVAELQLFLQRNELIKEQAKLILEFYKSEDA